MKRRIAFMLMGLALIASFAMCSPSSASADEHQDRCDELASAAYYHFWQGNDAYADQLLKWAGERGCDFGAIR